MTTSPLNEKLKLLERTVLPIYRRSRWPYQTHASKTIDRIQTRMIGILIGSRMRPGEDSTAFCMRRNRDAARVANSAGEFSAVWKICVLLNGRNTCTGIETGRAGPPKRCTFGAKSGCVSSEPSVLLACGVESLPVAQALEQPLELCTRGGTMEWI